jgi:FeS assembly protein IscX
MFNRYLFKRLFNTHVQKVKWNDGEDIAELLIKKHGKALDPLSLRFTQLHAMVTELPEFADEPENSTEKKLENIQMHWYDLFQDQ